MDIQPLNEWLVVEPLQAADKVGTLYIPGTHEAKFLRGVVLAVSEKAAEKLGAVEVGSIVIYDGIGAYQVRLEGETIVMLKANEVLGVVR